MATIITRVGKGSPLTFAELDANFTNLNNDKLERNGSIAMTGNLNLGGFAVTNGTMSAALLTSGTIPVARINGGTTGQFVRGDGAYSNNLVNASSTVLSLNGVAGTVLSAFWNNSQDGVRLGGSATNVRTRIHIGSDADAAGVGIEYERSSGIMRIGTLPTLAGTLTSVFSFDANRAVTIGTPIGGTALTVNAASSSAAAAFIGATGSTTVAINPAASTRGLDITYAAIGQTPFRITDGTCAFSGFINGSSGMLLNVETNHPFEFRTNNTPRVIISAAGNTTINAPSSGRPLQITNINTQLNVSLIGRPADGAAGIAFRNNADSAENAAIIASDTGLLSFWTSTTQRASVNSSGQWAFAAPSAGTTVQFNHVAGGTGVSVIRAVDANSADPQVSIGTSTQAINLNGRIAAGSFNNIAQNGDAMVWGSGPTVGSGALTLTVWSNTVSGIRITSGAISTQGNVTVNEPASGSALTINGVSGSNPLNISFSEAAAERFSLITNNGAAGGASWRATNNTATCSLGVSILSAGFVGTTTAHTLNISTNNLTRLSITSGGLHTFVSPVDSGNTVTINAPSNAVPPLSLSAFSAGGGFIAFTANGTTTSVGAAGGASALPATPVGYIRITVAGTLYNIPYYNI